MPAESISAGARVARLLLRDATAGNVAGGGTVTTGKQRLDGMTRIRGLFHSDEAPAANYPRVSFSPDGTNFTHVRVLVRDATQAGYAYRLDEPIEGPYAKVEWIHGATPADVLAFITATAGGGEGGGGVGAGAGAGGRQLVTTAKATEFSDAIAAGDHETEDLAGLASSKGTIRQVTLLAEQLLDYEVHFWSTDAFSNADPDLDAWLGRVTLLAADALQIAGAGLWRYVAQVELPYVDADNTTELHVSLVPTSGAKLANGAGGAITLRVVFDPEA